MMLTNHILCHTYTSDFFTFSHGGSALNTICSKLLELFTASPIDEGVVKEALPLFSALVNRFPREMSPYMSALLSACVSHVLAANSTDLMVWVMCSRGRCCDMRCVSILSIMLTFNPLLLFVCLDWIVVNSSSFHPSLLK